MSMCMQGKESSQAGIAPQRFVAEVEEFRATIADPSVGLVDERLAYIRIVRRAGLLDQDDAGFWGAGVALKEALETWLDFQPTTGN